MFIKPLRSVAPGWRGVARLAWWSFWVVLVASFAVPFARGFGWSWPEAAAALNGLGQGAGDPRAMSMGLQLSLLALVAAYVTARRLGPVQAAHRRRGLLGLRAMLLAVSLAGIAVSVERLATLAELVVARPLFDPPTDDRAFRDTLLVAVANAAATQSFDQAIADALAAADLDRAQAFIDAAGLLHQELQPATVEAYADATSWPQTLLRGTRDALSGAVTGDVRSVASLGGALATDLTPLGDLRDLAVQLGWREHPDRLLVGLSTVGLGLTAAVLLAPAPAASSIAAKSMLKATLRSSRTSAGLVGDVRRLAKGRRGLAVLADASGELAGIRKLAGTRATLAVLRQADGVADLPFYRRVARTFGDRTPGVVTVLGKDTKRAFRVYKAGRPVVAMTVGFAGMLAASIGGLLLSLSTWASTRLARCVLTRIARGGTALAPV